MVEYVILVLFLLIIAIYIGYRIGKSMVEKAKKIPVDKQLLADLTNFRELLKKDKTD